MTRENTEENSGACTLIKCMLHENGNKIKKIGVFAAL
jgi:hypothetical protein